MANHNSILRDLVPLNSLSPAQFEDLSKQIVVLQVRSGQFLFLQGDRDNRTMYLLDGEVNFVDARGRISGVVHAGTDPSRYPLANHQPRMVSARAARGSIIACIDSRRLDVQLTWDQSPASCGAVDIDTGKGNDWLTRMLQSDAFVKMAPADLQRLLQSMQSVPVTAGDVVIREGDEGDYFYIMKKGRCSVTRKVASNGWEVPLAELTTGDCFGEEALVSEARRNATITMLTDGTLMRLSKRDFLELLKKPLVHYVDYECAAAMVRSGGLWLDVRVPEEHARQALNGSLNIPLSNLRDKASKLSGNQRYIICCDTGRRSAAAAFLLTQRGFEVYVLEGGLNRVKGAFESTLAPAGSGVGTSDGVIEYEPQDQGKSGVSGVVDSGANGNGENLVSEETDYRTAYQQLRLQQKALLHERDQLRARIRLLEAKLMRPVAKRTDREHEIARETIREDR
jgi:CRP-like cAMP-binding protein